MKLLIALPFILMILSGFFTGLAHTSLWMGFLISLPAYSAGVLTGMRWPKYFSVQR